MITVTIETEDPELATILGVLDGMTHLTLAQKHMLIEKTLRFLKIFEPCWHRRGDDPTRVGYCYDTTPGRDSAHINTVPQPQQDPVSLGHAPSAPPSE